MEKVKDVQNYLREKGIIVAETWIVNAAVDLTRRLGADYWTFACYYKEKEE